MVSPAYTDTDIFHIVFCVALLSVTFQGALLPKVAKFLKLVDSKETVMKTFNDYQDEKDLSLIEIKVENEHNWCNKTLKQIALPQSMVVLMIKRNDKIILPKGANKVKPDDILVLGGAPYREDDYVQLREEEIEKNHDWVFKKVKEISFPDHTLIAVIRRGYRAIIPSGETTILIGDQIILCSVPKKE